MVDADRRLHRHVHAPARHHRGERGPARHPAVAALDLQRHPVGGRRLLADAGRLPPHRRGRRGHVRPARGVRRRARRVLASRPWCAAWPPPRSCSTWPGPPRAWAGPSCSPPRWPSSPRPSPARSGARPSGSTAPCSAGRWRSGRWSGAPSPAASGGGGSSSSTSHRRGGHRHHPGQDPGVQGPQQPPRRLDRIRLVLRRPVHVGARTHPRQRRRLGQRADRGPAGRCGGPAGRLPRGRVAPEPIRCWT